VSDEFKIYLNSKIGKRNKNLEVLASFFESNELQILKEKSISIVGTNGKTSSAFYLNEIFTKNDISSVLFTSPHLVDVNERIKINNEIISDKKISSYMDDLKQFESENNIELAYFETLFLTSCKLFLESEADYFIVEAGIGGLYDTTSILNVDTVCITNVNYDHMDLLGESLEEIFHQKIQISDNPKRIIFGDPNLYKVHKTYVHDMFDLTDKDIYLNDLESQNKMSLNFGTALKIFESIITNFDEDKTSNEESYPKAPGRFEEVSKNPIKIIDGAHNASSFETLVSFIEENHKIGDFDIYIGMKKGKNTNEFMNKIFAKNFNQIYLIENDSFFEQTKTSDFENYFNENGLTYKVANVDDFYTSKNPSILTGSLYLVGKYKKEYS
jgi:dihydrofolate synthase/folylpolyglutamate synthase